MQFTVSIKDHDTHLQVEMGRSILDCGIEQGAPLAYSCRSGNCGTCKCRLVSGEVEMSPYSEFALSAEEAERGLILACRSVPWSDCEIELLDEGDVVVHPHREMRCRVTALDALTHDIRRLQLEIEAGGPFVYSPGQYAEIGFPGLDRRNYSMAGQPEHAALEFYIRIVPDGRASEYLRAHLAVGDRVEVFGPYGSAYLREANPGPILAIAGGSGLAPIRSIVDRAVALGWEAPIHVYLGVRDERDLYLEDHFAALAGRIAQLHFTPVLSEPSHESARRTGLVTDAVQADLADLSEFTAYLAGPPPMVEAAKRLLPELGVAPGKIHADAFYTQAELDKEVIE